MKLFDRQKKQEINLYAYYDHAGIVRHLEDMARQGWQLEKAGSVFWTYRRAEPFFMAARTFSTCTTGSVSIGMASGAGLRKICI